MDINGRPKSIKKNLAKKIEILLFVLRVWVWSYEPTHFRRYSAWKNAEKQKTSKKFLIESFSLVMGKVLSRTIAAIILP